jgi:hypothetical protein
MISSARLAGPNKLTMHSPVPAAVTSQRRPPGSRPCCAASKWASPRYSPRSTQPPPTPPRDAANSR